MLCAHWQLHYPHTNPLQSNSKATSPNTNPWGHYKATWRWQVCGAYMFNKERKCFASSVTWKCSGGKDWSKALSVACMKSRDLGDSLVNVPGGMEESVTVSSSWMVWWDGGGTHRGVTRLGWLGQCARWHGGRCRCHGWWWDRGRMSQKCHQVVWVW